MIDRWIRIHRKFTPKRKFLDVDAISFHRIVRLLIWCLFLRIYENSKPRTYVKCKCVNDQKFVLTWIFGEFEFINLSLILIIDFIQLLWIIWLRKELFTPILTSFSVIHSVEIWKKFCHSDFTWNQFQGFLKFKTFIFAILEALKFDFGQFWPFFKIEIDQKIKIQCL